MPKHLLTPHNFEQPLFMDSSRIRAELGYSEAVPVSEALRRTIEWEKANPPERIDPAQYDYQAEDKRSTFGQPLILLLRERHNRQAPLLHQR